MSKTLKQKILSGVFWQGLCNISGAFIQLGISIVLARLIAPEDFGIIAIITVFIAFLDVFIDSGFGSALIQRKDLLPEDCNSVFFLNIILAFFLYALLFAATPFIAEFYNNQNLALYIRIVALSMVIGSFGIVPGTMLAREMRFGLIFKISLISQIISGIGGVIMAYLGYGIWALVTQMLSSSVIICVLRWLWGGWMPTRKINLKRLADLFSYGWKLFVSNSINSLYNNIYSLLMGRLFDLKTLAYYNRGHHIPDFAMGAVNNAMCKVLFPAFATLQDNKEQSCLLLKRGVVNTMFLVLPALALLYISADPVVYILYGEKWMPAVPFLKLFCFNVAFYPLHAINLQYLRANGRSDIFLILEIIKKIQIIIIILLTYRYGPLAMVKGMLFGTVLGFIENSWMSGKMLKYGPLKQLWHLAPILGVCLICGFLGHLSAELLTNIYLKTITGIIVFGVSYIIFCSIFGLFPQDITDFIHKAVSWIKKLNGQKIEIQ